MCVDVDLRLGRGVYAAAANLITGSLKAVGVSEITGREGECEKIKEAEDKLPATKVEGMSRRLSYLPPLNM